MGKVLKRVGYLERARFILSGNAAAADMCAEMSCLLSVFVFGLRLLSLLFIALCVRITSDFVTRLFLVNNEMVSAYDRWVDI